MLYAKSIFLAAVSLSASQAANQDAVLLRRALAPATETYTITTKVAQTVKGPMGEIPMNILSDSTYALKMTSVDAQAGTGVIETTTTFDKISADGPLGNALGNKPAPLIQKGKIDIRNRITFEKSGKETLSSFLSGGGSTSSSGYFVELPEKAVKVGDTWDIIVPKGPMTAADDQKLVAKLTGEKEVDGVAVWVVSVTGTVNINIDSSKLPQDAQVSSPAGAMTMLIKGKVDTTGEGLIDKKTGQTIQMTTKGTMKQSVELIESGMTIDTAGTVESTVKLKKA